MPDWTETFDFADIDPVEHKESKNSLAEIMYDDAYKAAIGYMRALMARDEHSERALAVAEAVIMKNPAHYTAWHYRLQILKDRGDEIVPKETRIFNVSPPGIEPEEEEDSGDEKGNNTKDESESKPQSKLEAQYEELEAQLKKELEGLEGSEEEEKEQPVNLETAFEKVPEEEMPVIENYTWLNKVTLDNAKNYQIWHYRQQLAPNLYTNSPEAIKLYYDYERLLVEIILADDAKNIHAWSHLIWLVNWAASPFGSKPKDKQKGWFKDVETENKVRHISQSMESELAFIENLLFEDVYNNSAWSYRHVIVSRALNANSPNPEDNKKEVSQDDDGDNSNNDNNSNSKGQGLAILNREVVYAKYSIALAPQNESPWNYITALVRDFYAAPNASVYKLGINDQDKMLATLRELVDEYIPLEFQAESLKPIDSKGKEEEEKASDDMIILQSTHAIEALVDIYMDLGQATKALRALALLQKYIPMRKGYWQYLESIVKTQN